MEAIRAPWKEPRALTLLLSIIWFLLWLIANFEDWTPTKRLTTLPVEMSTVLLLGAVLAFRVKGHVTGPVPVELPRVSSMSTAWIAVFGSATIVRSPLWSRWPASTWKVAAG